MLLSYYGQSTACAQASFSLWTNPGCGVWWTPGGRLTPQARRTRGEVTEVTEVTENNSMVSQVHTSRMPARARMTLCLMLLWRHETVGQAHSNFMMPR